MYNILDIKNLTPQRGVRYLFDANIWLTILDLNYQKEEYKPYLKFFNAIINSDGKDDIKIVMPSILLSEIINRKMGMIYEEFLKNPVNKSKIYDILSGTMTPKKYHKEVYRLTEEYKIQYRNLCHSFISYHLYLKLVSDNLGEYTCNKLLKNPLTQMEFNDYLLFKLAEKNGYTIVTHDGDYGVENVTILTTIKKILALSINQHTDASENSAMR